MTEIKRFDAARAGLLDGVRVVDLSRLVAGNMATHVLADYGADVIKVERPGKGDDLRSWRVKGIEVFWKVYSRNKRSVALDLQSDDGREFLWRLIDTAQILVENFVPGTLERWGMGPDDLLRRNPKLIMLARVRLGPDRAVAQQTRLRHAGRGDVGLGLHERTCRQAADFAAARARRHDLRSLWRGRGARGAARRRAEAARQAQVIDLSLFEPIHAMVGAEAAHIRLPAQPTMRSGNQSSHTAPRNVYRCKDDRYVAMSGSMQSMAEKIMETIGRPELKTDPRFIDNTARVAHRNELDEIIGAFIAQRSQAENLALFEAAGVTVGPVCSVADLMSDPYVEGREAIVEVEDRDLGSMPMHNVIPRFSAMPEPFRRQAPSIGEHTEDIRRELGLPAAKPAKAKS